MNAVDFIQHQRAAEPKVIGVRYNCGSAEEARRVAEELQQQVAPRRCSGQAGIVRVDGTWVKWQWGAE